MFTGIVSRIVYLLSSWKLELGASEGLDAVGLVGVLRSDGHKGLANVDAGNCALRFAEGTSHTGLQTIGTGTRQHLVDTQDVKGVDTHSDVETILADGLDQVLVGANTSGLERFGRELFILIGD